MSLTELLKLQAKLGTIQNSNKLVKWKFKNGRLIGNKSEATIYKIIKVG